MSDVMSAAGSWSALLLGLGGLGGLVVLALAGMAMGKRRIPLVALALLPILTLILGALATWAAAGDAFEAMRAATPGEMHDLALNGVFNSQAVDALSRWAAAFVLALACWVCAVASGIAAGSDAKMTPVAALSTGAITLVGTGALAWYTGANGLGSQGGALVGVFLIGGLGVSASALRRATDEEMFRVAAARLVGAFSFVIGVFHAARALDIGLQSSIFGVGGLVSQAPDLPAKVVAWHDAALPAQYAGLLAFLLAITIGAIAFIGEIGEAVDRFTMRDGLVVALLLLVAGAARFVELNRVGALYNVGTSFPAAQTYKEMTSDLPGSTLVVGEATLFVRPVNGGYGDVFQFQRDKWVRTYRWDGYTWQHDNTPLDAVSNMFTGRTPLAAISKNEDMEALVTLLDASPEKKVLMLLRAAEAKAGTEVPPELGREQVTFLPVELASSRDLKTEIWQLAGAFDVYWGPTSWYGPGDDTTDPFAYARAAIEATKGPGLLTLGFERKTGDLAISCMRYITDLSEDSTKLEATDRWCRLTMDEPEPIRVEAAALWDYPETPNMKMSIEYKNGVDTAHADDLIKREQGAFAWCAERRLLPPPGSDPAAPPPVVEPVVGIMTMNLALGKTGEIFDTLLDEKSKLADLDLIRCVGKRLKPIVLKVTQPDPEDPKAADKAPAVKITLEYLAPPATPAG